ncbi:DUF1906 domain-containing protein [Streptomyces sp. NPDC048172]|uniref:DUF1906 domain-containing protein n=1 Tax=Streptomyces sp. NPDC048172 TaxID=3365505 RepID=UPI00371A2FC6
MRQVVVFLAALASLLTGGSLPANASTGAGAGPATPDSPESPGKKRTGAAAGPPSLIQGDPRRFGARTFSGHAFDACQAPSYATMRAWRKSSPYGAVGVYIGGRGRGCPNQKNLTPSWTRGVHRMGWKMLPLYVGSQSPCVIAKHKRKFAMSHSSPYTRGRREGMDAVQRARALGMVPRTTIYLDMEAYRQKESRCAATTLRFIQGWDAAVRQQRYIPGFYSSADSGITHIERARAAGSRGLPTALWFARWRVPASTGSERRIHPLAWQPHRRIHQFTGNVKRTYGGHTLHIDQNLVDAPVAVMG